MSKITINQKIIGALDKFWNTIEGVVVKRSDVVNTLASTSTNLPLSAYQGKMLDEKKGNKAVWIDFGSAFSTLPQTRYSSSITSDMVVASNEMSNPSAQTGDWTVNTYDGSVTVTGTISGSTTLKILLVPQNTPVVTTTA